MFDQGRGIIQVNAVYYLLVIITEAYQLRIILIPFKGNVRASLIREDNAWGDNWKAYNSCLRI